MLLGFIFLFYDFAHVAGIYPGLRKDKAPNAVTSTIAPPHSNNSNGSHRREKTKRKKKERKKEKKRLVRPWTWARACKRP